MADVKMVYGAPPRPNGRPMLLSEIEDAQKVNPDFEPGWQATEQGYINERFGARLHVAVCDEEMNPKFDKIVMVSSGAGTCPWGIDPGGNVRVALQWSFREVIRRVDRPYEAFEDLNTDDYGVWSLETPRGFNKSALSDTEDTAVEELAEETGYGEPKRVQLLGTYVPDTAFDAVPIPIYAVQTEIVPPDPSLLELDPGEEFGGVIGWVTLDEVTKLVADQAITCGYTLASLSQFKAAVELDRLIGLKEAEVL
ncbi:MAG: NUDIX domain-containing protein [Candidatus Spechtbacterales bacterium]|nr:NUDIX domain-containing protein [Candidatus Spechtbacterales bacterium]